MTQDEQAEQHRLRRTTRHLILSIGAVAVFGLALLALYVLMPRSPEPTPPSPSPTPTTPVPQPQQQTVLIQATTAAGALGNVLTAISDDAQPQAVLLAVPADLVVSAPGVPAQPLAQTVTSLDTLRSATSVAATLGVRVDATWRLDRKALAGLVDSVAGITVTVAERARVRDAEGEVVLVLRRGRQRLTGTAASWYAVGQVAGQTDLAATARFEHVLLRTLARLPDSDLAIRESLTALGALAPSTIGTQDLATYLHGLSGAVRRGWLLRGTIPSTQIRLGTDAFPDPDSGAGADPDTDTDAGPDTDTGGSPDRVVLPIDYRWTQYAEATPLIRRTLPAALWQASEQGPPRVLVTAPNSAPGWLGHADRVLSDADFVFVDGRGTPHRSPPGSRITVRGPAQWGRDVATALGIPTDRVRQVASATEGPPWADVAVSLGRRWTPGTGDEE